MDYERFEDISEALLVIGLFLVDSEILEDISDSKLEATWSVPVLDFEIFDYFSEAFLDFEISDYLRETFWSWFFEFSDSDSSSGPSSTTTSSS